MLMKRDPASAARSLVSQACVVLHALQDQGHDVARIMRAHDISARQLSEPWQYMDAAQVSGLWRDAEELLGADAGLLISRYIDTASYYDVGYCSISAPTALEGLRVFTQFYPLVCGNGLLLLEEQGGRVSLVFYDHPDVAPARSEVDALFASIMAVIHRHCMGEVLPVAAELQPRQRAGGRLFRDYLGVSASFSATHDTLHFRRQDLMAPVTCANPIAYRRLWRELSRKMNSQDRSFSERVSAMLLHVLPGGVYELDEISRRMGVSPRTLQRRLSAEGIVFSELLEQSRKMIAARSIRSGQWSIKEIAYTLGYADINNFSRAFKRWFGIPPSRYGAEAGRDAPRKVHDGGRR